MFTKDLPLAGQIQLANKMADDLLKFAEAGVTKIGRNRQYVIQYEEDDDSELARKAALKALASKSEGLKKVAFDTRKVNQETERNPRSNLQYWQRSEPFITESDQNMINALTKTMDALNDIKKSFASAPEYHESKARQLHDHIERALRLKIGDQDIFKPQLLYIEQILDARYRMKVADIQDMSISKIKEVILSKDEPLLRRGAYYNATGGMEKTSVQTPNLQSNAMPIVIDGNAKAAQGLLDSLFASTRKDGERIVERTITITVKDEVKD